MSAFDATIVLRCGALRLWVDRAEMGLDELCGYASRRSRKRGFVFISKVLGKHYPVRPALMARTHTLLAAKIHDLRGPAVLIALAETATGLGQGIYETWVRDTGRTDLLFLHTTRYHLRRPLALNFEETHSHATEHLVYAPDDEVFQRAETLVLVDDEISTGRTLANLATAYRRMNPRLRAVHCVCLTDWLGTQRRAEMAARIGLPTAFHSLLQGSFTFEDNPQFDPGNIPAADGPGDFKDPYLPRNHGRFGVRGLLQYDLDDVIRAAGVRPGEKVLVLGSGEFTYPPYLLAQRLETLGWDVFFQSTTRSPLLVDGDLTSVLHFPDNYHDGIANYLYNVADRHHDRILIGYETAPLPADHQLALKLGAQCVFF